MDDIVDLETSRCPSTQLPYDVDSEVGAEVVEGTVPFSDTPTTGRGHGRGEGRKIDVSSSPFASISCSQGEGS